MTRTRRIIHSNAFTIAVIGLLSITVIITLILVVQAQSKAASAAKTAAAAAKAAAAVSAHRTSDLESELARFKAFTGDVLCGVLQPLGVLTPPPNITSVGLTLLHGAKHGSDRLACPAPKGP